MTTSRAVLRLPLRRGFHTSTPSCSHIGSLPVPIPPTINLTLPPLSISPSLPHTSPQAQRTIKISGPLGTQSLLLPPSIILHPTTPSSTSTPSETTLTLSVHDATVKTQRSLWGLHRSLISNAVTGLSTGFTLELRLVGVGYRAAVEPIPPLYLDLQERLPRTIRPSKPGQPPYIPPPFPTGRLNMKLGYAHPVLIDIPHGISVTTPTPTRIELKGTDKQKLGLFAAKIRRWRKPEPYRGKGIFVGDETIKIKEVKKK